MVRGPAHGGESRERKREPVDFGRLVRFPAPWSEAAGVFEIQLFVEAPSGWTGMLFTRNWVLDTMTLSPAFNPEVTEYELPTVSPRVTGIWEATNIPFCCLATNTKLCPPCRVTANTGIIAMGDVLHTTFALI